MQSLRFLQRLADMADEDLSRGRQDEFFRQALKDRRAQLGFQRQNLAADGGGRDVQMVGRLAIDPVRATSSM